MSLGALLSGGTEPNVDVALYLLPSTGLLPSSAGTGAFFKANITSGPSLLDIECMRNLQLKTNVIPLLSLADIIPIDELVSTKHRISQDLKHANIDCFTFSQPSSSSELPFVYAVSSVTPLDYGTIDASILMASDYRPPLVCTDLNSLVTEVMSVDGSAWLRHSAASKAVRWLRQRSQNGPSHHTLIYRELHSKASLASMQMTGMHTNQRYLDRTEMSNWAETLRQSLSLERFDVFQQQSRVHMVDEYLSLMRMDCRRPRLRSGRRPTAALISSHQDPLGLLGLASKLQIGGKLTLELLSSFGILGCVIAWIVSFGRNYRISGI